MPELGVDDCRSENPSQRPFQAADPPEMLASRGKVIQRLEQVSILDGDEGEGGEATGHAPVILHQHIELHGDHRVLSGGFDITQPDRCSRPDLMLVCKVLLLGKLLKDRDCQLCVSGRLFVSLGDVISMESEMRKAAISDGSPSGPQNSMLFSRYSMAPGLRSQTETQAVVYPAKRFMVNFQPWARSSASPEPLLGLRALRKNQNGEMAMTISIHGPGSACASSQASAARRLS